MVALTVRYWPGRYANSSRKVSGTAKARDTLSAVSRRRSTIFREWKRLIGSGSDAFEMIERLAAGAAAPEGLARRRAEFRDAFGLARAAARTADGGGRGEQGALARDALGRGYAGRAELFARRLAHALGRPGGRIRQPDARVGKAVLHEFGLDSERDDAHRRTAGIGRQNRDRDPSRILDRDVMQNAEVVDREDRHFGVRHARRRGPGGLL